MSSNLDRQTTVDTLKIRAGTRADLEQAEKELSEKFSLEKFQEVRWLKRTAAFYESDEYEQYKKANG